MDRIETYLQVLRNYYETGLPYRNVPVINTPVYRDVFEKLSQNKKILVVGDPGSGKTTMLDWIAYQTANNKKHIPIFASLRNYTSTLSDLLTVSVKRFNQDITIEQIRLAKYEPVYLLDGLDEISDGIRFSVYKEISAFISTNINCGIAITTRSAFSELFNEEVGLEIVNMIPFTIDQIRQILSNVPNGNKIWDAVSGNNALLRMVSQPFFLKTLVGFWEKETEFDQNFISQIMAYSSWRGNTKSLSPATVSLDLVDRAYQLLALDATTRSEKWFPISRVDEIASELLDKPDKIALLVEAICSGDPIIQDGRRIRFRQQTYQTTFAVKALTQLLKSSQRDFNLVLRSVIKSSIAQDVFERFFTGLSKDDFSLVYESIPKDLWDKLIDLSGESILSQIRSLSLEKGSTEWVFSKLLRVNNFLLKTEGRRRVILVISLPGFNTRGEWQHQLGKILNLETDGEKFVFCICDYGDFRFGILNPFSRNKKVKNFHQYYNTLISQFSVRPEVCVVAHSFGTYIVGNALRRFPEIKFDRVLFLGSVLKSQFDWREIGTRCVQGLNIIGRGDWVLWLASKIPGLGQAGRNGFYNPPGHICQRFENNSDHCDLFGEMYMREVWVPFLRNGAASEKD